MPASRTNDRPGRPRFGPGAARHEWLHLAAACGLFLILHLGLGWGTAWAQESRAGEEVMLPDLVRAQVVQVVDGDTFVAAFAGTTSARVRLVGVDAPESRHPTRGEEPYGVAAAAFLRELLPPGTTVYLEFDVEVADSNGRLLAYAYLADGRMVNEVLLEEGYAQLYTFPPNVRYVERFRRAQQAGREAQRGLWALTDEALPGPGAGSSPEQGPRVRVAAVNLGAEWVEIWNGGPEAVDLTGWRLVSERGNQVFRFPDGFVLAPGATVTITSGQALEDRPALVLGWTRANVWSDSGDPAVLLDAEGHEIHRFP